MTTTPSVSKPDISIGTDSIGTDSVGRRWFDVCHRADLEPEWGEAALIDGRQLAVFRLWDDRVLISSNLDPRTGSAVLARGIVGTRGGGIPTIASPLHKELYSLLTGECFSNVDLELAVFPTETVDSLVRVALPALGN